MTQSPSLSLQPLISEWSRTFQGASLSCPGFVPLKLVSSRGAVSVQSQVVSDLGSRHGALRLFAVALKCSCLWLRLLLSNFLFPLSVSEYSRSCLSSHFEV